MMRRTKSDCGTEDRLPPVRDGRLRTREYEGQNYGGKRQRTEIVARVCNFSAPLQGIQQQAWPLKKQSLR